MSNLETCRWFVEKFEEKRLKKLTKRKAMSKRNATQLDTKPKHGKSETTTKWRSDSMESSVRSSDASSSLSQQQKHQQNRQQLLLKKRRSSLQEGSASKFKSTNKLIGSGADHDLIYDKEMKSSRLDDDGEKGVVVDERLEPDYIVGTLRKDEEKKIYFFMKWKYPNVLNRKCQFIESKYANEHYPQTVIKYYETKIQFVTDD